MIFFAYDWVTPRGLLGNGNPVAALMDDTAFREGEDGIHFETPFVREGFTPMHHILQAREIAVFDAIKQDTAVIYEMMTTGLMGHAFGRWSNPHHRSLFHNVSKEIKEHCRRGRATILINASFEGDALMSDRVFEEIHNQIAYENLPLSQIIFATGNLRCRELYERWLSTQPPRERITVVPVTLFEGMMKWPVHSDPQNFLTPEEVRATSIRPKHFLSFNRRAHIHRQVIVSQFLARGLRDKFHLSMSVPAEGRFTPREFDKNSWTTVFPKIRSEITAMEASVPLIVDADEFLTNHAFTHVKEPYLESYINVVTETQYFDPTDELLFLSEKVYKPIVNMQPFIIVGVKNTLRILRDHGYKTFAPFINEAYDEEADPYLRMKMIVEEIERLCALPLSELEEWYKSIFEEVLLHNRNVFMHRDCAYELRELLIRASSSPLSNHLRRLFGGNQR